MKRSKIIWLVLLLSLCMALSACGGGNKPADNPSDPGHPDGTEPIETEQVTDETTTEAAKEQLPEALVGTWELSWGECLDFDDTPIASFTLGADGMLTFNDKSLQMELAEGALQGHTEDGKEYLIRLETDYTHFDGEKLTGGLHLEGFDMNTGNRLKYTQDEMNINAGRFYKNVERVELTPDNWQDYFEYRDVFGTLLDPTGEIGAITRYSYLVVKDPEHMVDIIDGIVELTFQYGPIKHVHYNTETGESYLTDATDEENQANSRYVNPGVNDIWPAKGAIRLMKIEDSNIVALYVSSSDSFLFDEEGYQTYGLEWDGNEASAIIMSTVDILEVTRFEGTLLIQK